MLEAQEVNTPEEVHEVIKRMNESLRKILESERFGQKFSDEEKTFLSQHLCFDWSVDIKIPICSQKALPVILVDLPGSTEGGLIGEFIKTMIRGSCMKASMALVLLTPDMIAELDHKRPDLMERFFGGASNVGGYHLVITKVFDKKVLDQIIATVCKKSAQLKPELLGIHFINSYILRAHVASCAGPLPGAFPSLEVDASDEEKRRCEGEQQRCQIIFSGVENRLMQKKDQKKFNGKDLEEEVKEKLDEFPETASFTSKLYSSVDQRFAELFLGPHLERMQRCIKRLVDEICHQVEICLGSERRRQANIDACRKLLGNLDVEIMEPVKKKAWLEIQGKIEEMAKFDSHEFAVSMIFDSDENKKELHNHVCETFGPEFYDWCRHDVTQGREAYFDQIKFSAERESTRAYEQILRQELAGKIHAMGPSPREVEIDDEVFWNEYWRSLLQVQQPGPGRFERFRGAVTYCVSVGGAAWGAHTAFAIAPVYIVSVASIVRAAWGAHTAFAIAPVYIVSVASIVHTVLAMRFIMKADHSLGLEALQAHADRNLSILSEASKGWVQKTLERRLRMLEEQLDASDVPHLEEKLQKNLQALANLQEISACVKEEVKQRTSPAEDAGAVALSGFILDFEGAFCDDVCFVFGSLTLVIGRRCGRRRGEIALRNS